MVAGWLVSCQQRLDELLVYRQFELFIRKPDFEVDVQLAKQGGPVRGLLFRQTVLSTADHSEPTAFTFGALTATDMSFQTRLTSPRSFLSSRRRSGRLIYMVLHSELRI